MNGYCRGCGSERIFGRAKFCFLCWEYKQAVVNMVSNAIRKGQMPRPSGNCTWCEAPAKVWDHRDYSKPFDVIPLCYSCNNKAPPGLMPENLPIILSLKERLRKRDLELKQIKARKRKPKRTP